MNRDDGRVVRGHGGPIPESIPNCPLFHVATQTWPTALDEFCMFLVDDLRNQSFSITLHHEEGHCALGRGRELNDEGGAPTLALGLRLH